MPGPEDSVLLDTWDTGKGTTFSNAHWPLGITGSAGCSTILGGTYKTWAPHPCTVSSQFPFNSCNEQWQRWNRLFSSAFTVSLCQVFGLKRFHSIKWTPREFSFSDFIFLSSQTNSGTRIWRRREREGQRSYEIHIGKDHLLAISLTNIGSLSMQSSCAHLQSTNKCLFSRFIDLIVVFNKPTWQWKYQIAVMFPNKYSAVTPTLNGLSGGSAFVCFI